jgi:hypothetical protein
MLKYKYQLHEISEHCEFLLLTIQLQYHNIWYWNNYVKLMLSVPLKTFHAEYQLLRIASLQLVVSSGILSTEEWVVVDPERPIPYNYIFKKLFNTNNFLWKGKSWWQRDYCWQNHLPEYSVSTTCNQHVQRSLDAPCYYNLKQHHYDFLV